MIKIITKLRNSDKYIVKIPLKIKVVNIEKITSNSDSEQAPR